MREKHNNQERQTFESDNPFQSVMDSSFFFRLNVRLISLALVFGGMAALVAGLMVRFCAG